MHINDMQKDTVPVKSVTQHCHAKTPEKLALISLINYSRLPIARTFKGNYIENDPKGKGSWFELGPS